MINKGLTIDGFGSKDLDDAIWAEVIDGHYKLTISIANVAKQLQTDSELDQHAKQNMFSIYRGYAGCVKPMLPRSLSENDFSLLQGKERDVLVFEITLDNTLNCIDITLAERVFRNDYRLTHENVVKVLDNEDHELHDQMKLLSSIALKLLNHRRDSGALAVYDISSGWSVTEDGKLQSLDEKERTIGYIIVQEFMILVNSVMATYVIEHDIPCLFRNHQVKSAAPDVSELSRDLQQGTTSNDLQFMQHLSDNMSLVMQPAKISPSVRGHYGLNLPAYAYFTSPIRRYPDLINQHLLLAHLHKTDHLKLELEHISTAYNLKEKEARNSKSEVLRSNAWKKGRINLEILKFDILNEKDLYRVVRVCMEDDSLPPKELESELFKRFNNRTLDHVTTAAIFSSIGSKFSEQYKLSFIESILDTPHLASMIMNSIIQKYNGSELHFDNKSTGPSHKPMHSVTATLSLKGKTLFSNEITNPVKKTAIQLVTLDLLQQLIGTHIQLNKKTNNNSKSAHNIKVKKNYKGKLIELCQKEKYPMPVFTTSVSGPSHQPKYNTKLTIKTGNNLVETTSKDGKSKKEAEQLAAKYWLSSNQ